MTDKFTVLFVVSVHCDKSSPYGLGLGIHISDLFTSIEDLQLLKNCINAEINERLVELRASIN
jgi:hypothetical protein